MEDVVKRQKSDSFHVATLLFLVGGFLEAYSYITRDGVFANAQTGNMVMLGLKLLNKEFKNAFYYFIPIIAYASGIIMAEFIRELCKNIDNSKIHWRQIVVLIEIIILTCIGFLPLGKYNIITIISISFTCALQVESFRKVNGRAIATTMCTGNLRSFSESLYKYFSTKDKELLKKSIHYFLLISVFIIGAVFGAIFTKILSVNAVFICSGLLTVVFLIMFDFKNDV